MRRYLIGFLVGGILGVAAGFAVGIFVFPYLFPPPPANQQIADRDRQVTVATGTFIHADPGDPIHYGSGSVAILKDPAGKQVVFLEKDFDVGPGPDFRVYLVKHAAPREKDHVRAGFVDIGGLMSFKGSQIYELPAGIDLSQYGSVVIWCRAFSQLISPATLTRL